MKAKVLCVRRQNGLNRKKFQNMILYIPHSPSISMLCPNILTEKWLLHVFCDQTLYITNVYKQIYISRITKLALFNNFRNDS